MGRCGSVLGMALALSLTTATSAAPTGECLSEAEGTAVFAAMLPDMIGGLRDKCAAQLPADAYIVTNGEAMVARYRALADERWPLAKQAFGRIAGDEEMAAKLPDEYFRPLLGAMVGGELVKDIKAEDCSGANRIVENLAPLPPENVAALIGAILVLADKDGKDGLPMCRS